jgi:nucleotide-binding universal stress UspA family protein
MAIKRILVPTDFSAASKAALKYACGLADSLNASLDILHAVDYPYSPGAYTEFYSLPQEFFDELETDARRSLEAVLTADAKERYRATLALRKGAAAREILSYLGEHHDIDLVVMATQGRGGVGRLMMGSVADKIVRTAPCPVVTIRASEATEAGAGRAA